MSQNENRELREVVVYTDTGDGVRQPRTFHMCGLGLQFYSNRKIPEFELMEMNIRMDETAAGDADIHCIGAVVKCSEVNDPQGRYRVWLKFIDTPAATCGQLSCIARKGKHLCSFCENF